MEIAIAIDISGSISNEEFKQAMKEVFQIVKRYKHAVTIIECDEEIRRVRYSQDPNTLQTACQIGLFGEDQNPVEQLYNFLEISQDYTEKLEKVFQDV